MIHLGIIGGSNSVMTPGYASSLPKCMERRGIHISKITNLSVGNTTSITGLIRLNDSDVTKDIDLLIIEYSLNDESFYGDNRAAFERWAFSYELLLRTALKLNSNIKILSVIFSTKNNSSKPSPSAISSGIYYFSEWYGTHKVDVNMKLGQIFGCPPALIDNAYADSAHYSRPITTQLISEIVADAIEKIPKTPLKNNIPHPINPLTETICSNFDCSTLNASKKTFLNSKFQIDTIDINNNDFNFFIENGRILAIEYVCTQNVGDLFLTLDNRTFKLSTLRSGIRDGRYSFLLSTINLLEPPTPNQNSSLISLSTAPMDDFTLVKQKNSIEAPTEARSFYLKSILHTGSIKLLDQ